MNSFFNSPMIKNMMPAPMQNMMNIVQQAQQIRQNPNALATLLQQRGLINQQQAKDIQSMGSNYQQIGQYLMQNGRIPSDVRNYEGQVNQLQNMLK